MRARERSEVNSGVSSERGWFKVKVIGAMEAVSCCDWPVIELLKARLFLDGVKSLKTHVSHVV